MDRMDHNLTFIKILQKKLHLKEDVHLLTKKEYWEKVYPVDTNIESIFSEQPKIITEKKALPKDFVIQHFFYEYIHKLLFFILIPKFVVKKFHFWDKILKNIFISDDMKEQIWQIFSEAQQIYYGFTRLAFIYKFKKATIKINTDLYMNELTIGEKNVYTLLQDNSKYLFTVMDLTHIINTALSNLSYFFVSLLKIKNPYNNVNLSISALYNIYFFIKHHHFIVSSLFQNFFLCNFDLYIFERENETLIKTIGIENYAFKTPHNYLYDDIKHMLRINKTCTTKLSIHKDFPRDKLVDIFRPYLHLYYLYRYFTHGTVKQKDAFVELNKKLQRFVLFNPFFGRKMMLRENKIIYFKKSNIKESFNMKHIDFYSTQINLLIGFDVNYVLEEEEEEDEDEEDEDESDTTTTIIDNTVHDTVHDTVYNTLHDTVQNIIESIDNIESSYDSSISDIGNEDVRNSII